MKYKKNVDESEIGNASTEESPKERSEISTQFLQAAKEVDRSLLRWCLERSPLQRLEECTRATRALSGFRRVPSSRS